MNQQFPALEIANYTTLPEAGAVLVTGSTGFLGAYLLREMMDASSADIYCLVRASDKAAGLARIIDNMESYSLETGDLADRVHVVCGDIALPHLGMSDDVWHSLCKEVDIVFHGAARMNWIESFKNLEPINVGGTANAIEFVNTGKQKTLQFVSTTGVYMSMDVPELGYLNKDQPLEKYGRHVIGYLKSKWVAERTVRAAIAGGVAGTIHRPSFILGDVGSGFIPEGDLTKLFLKACLEARAVPDLKLFIDAVPVDVVARAIVNVASRRGQNGRAYNLSQPAEFNVSELSNISRDPLVRFELLPLDVWLDRLRDLPVSEAIRIMLLFGWPVPGAPEGLITYFSEVDLDPANVDIDEALEGSGMLSPSHSPETLDLYLASILSKPPVLTAENPAP